MVADVVTKGLNHTPAQGALRPIALFYESDLFVAIACFLASDKTRYVTGAVLDGFGGLTVQR